MYCKELNKDFESKAQMFAELKANKSVLKAQKKSDIKKKINDFTFANKEGNGVIKEVPGLEKGFIYPVISNTNYLDSHGDVHLNGSMTKTSSDQQGKVFYLTDHKMQVDSIIATPKNVEMMLKEVSWKDLGRDYEGTTQALMFKISENKLMHEKAIKLIQEKEDMQNSIRMMYVNLDLAVNSEDEDYKEEYKNWLETYPKIANKEVADERGYFWAVRELKIVNEGSMVLFGSNDATPMNNKENEAVNSDTSKKEPSNDTQMTVAEMLKKVNF